MALKQKSEPKNRETRSERSFGIKARAFCKGLDKVMGAQQLITPPRREKPPGRSKAREDKLRNNVIEELGKLQKQGKELGIEKFLEDIPSLVEGIQSEMNNQQPAK